MGELLIILVLVQFVWIYKLDTQLKDTQDTLNHIAKLQSAFTDWCNAVFKSVKDHKKNGS